MFKNRAAGAPMAWKRPAARGTHTLTCPLLWKEVCVAAGSGAHLHTFDERVQAITLTCSDAARSTHLLGRCRICERRERGHFVGPRCSQIVHAPKGGHDLRAQSSHECGNRSGATWGMQYLRWNRWLPGGLSSGRARATASETRRGGKPSCAMASRCGLQCACAAFRAMACAGPPLRRGRPLA